ncbi:MAG: hypothetical protein V3R81_04885, partial [Gammaproteobacteria bacterium]
WMEAAPEQAGTLYVDGHVRVYNGHQTKLPRHYVSRQKLCLRATSDYWVNAMDGQPFFVVHRAVDPGMIKVLEQDIVPRLECDVPEQPGQATLDEDPLAHRFTLVFDREGYSPALFKTMRAKRIACISYHKFPGDDWPPEEFRSCTVEMPGGQQVAMKLAERGTHLGKMLWVREIRKLTERGHQTAIIASDYRSDPSRIAVAMFSRWSQENFFKYAREHFNLDRLTDYRTEAVSDTTPIVNPDYRRLDGLVRSCNAKLSRQLAKFGAMNLVEQIDAKPVASFLRRKAEQQESVQHLQNELEKHKQARKQTPRHITVQQLPEDQRFEQLSTPTKHLIDTIKMIAYRSETAMAGQLQCAGVRPNETRRLLRALYSSSADLLPNYDEGILTIRVHHMANHCSDAAIHKLLDELNTTQTHFPDTNLRLVLKLGS